MPDATLLSAAELAQRWKVSTRTIHRMVDRHQLKLFAQGPGPTGAFLFSLEDVEAAENEPAAEAS